MHWRKPHSVSDGEGTSIVRRGGRFITESQPAGSSSLRESGLMHHRSRLAPHAPIREFERGASLLFLFVVLFPIALVGGLCLGYAAYAPEPIKYELSLKTE